MSLQIINEITLDCNNLKDNSKIEIKQGNNLSNVILVSINHNNQPLQLNNLTVRYVISRANGSQNLSDAIIEDNKVKIVLSKKDLSCAGLASCEVILSDKETVVFSSVFYIKILPNVLDNDRIKCSDEFSSIIDVINKVNADLKIINQNEALRVTKETIRNENETQRQKNELERQSNFSNIQNTSNNILKEHQKALEETKIQSQNAKTQAEYAKSQGNYAKTQADRVANTDVSNLSNDIDDIKSYIGYTNSDIYGVEVDFKNKTFKRLAGASNLTEGNSFNQINAYNRRRCILKNDGTVVAYYGDDNYTETGKLADNTEVQVMVEQPKFYYKVVPLELEPVTNGKGYHLRKVRYYISDTQKQGFKLHPAFMQNGKQKDKIYVSAYGGCIYDTSANTYLLNDEQVADFNRDKLSSIKNAKLCSGLTQNLTRANARKLANNRGSGWNLSTIQSISATQLLFLIEYASFNMQEKIGIGVTNKTLGQGNQSEVTGATSNLGNSTGKSQNNSISYRGEENFYGNINNWVDGINIYNYNKGYVFIADNNFSDDINTSPYEDAGIKISSGRGYISAFAYNFDYDWLFIPSESNGNSSVPVGDFFYHSITAQNFTATRFGGAWYDNTTSGGFNFILSNISSFKHQDTGASLIYIPQ